MFKITLSLKRQKELYIVARLYFLFQQNSKTVVENVEKGKQQFAIYYHTKFMKKDQKAKYTKTIHNMYHKTLTADDIQLFFCKISKRHWKKYSRIS